LSPLLDVDDVEDDDGFEESRVSVLLLRELPDDEDEAVLDELRVLSLLFIELFEVEDDDDEEEDLVASLVSPRLLSVVVDFDDDEDDDLEEVGQLPVEQPKPIENFIEMLPSLFVLGLVEVPEFAEPSARDPSRNSSLDGEQLDGGLSSRFSLYRVAPGLATDLKSEA
jgi:hypothetical protein